MQHGQCSQETKKHGKTVHANDTKAKMLQLGLRNAKVSSDALEAGLKRERRASGDPGMADIWTSEFKHLGNYEKISVSHFMLPSLEYLILASLEK